jgi:putative spermidine/putrescine transport system permease protein
MRVLRPALFLAVLVSSVAPLLLLLVRARGRDWFFPALLPSGTPIDTWRALGGDRLLASAMTGILIGLVAGGVATVLALPVGRSLARLSGWQRWVAAGAVFLPVAVPPVALGTGLQLSLLTLGLGGTHVGVALAHLVPATGYLSLYFLGVFAAFDEGYEMEARSLGASPRQVWTRLLLPLLRRPIAEAVALGFLISWAQVPLTLLVGAGAVRTLPVEVLAFVRAGQDQLAAAGALLLVIPALAALSGASLVARRADVVGV